MHLCYVDEAGCPGALPSATSDVQPVLVIAGLFVPQAQLTSLTRNFLQLKRHFNPGLAPAASPWLDLAKNEIKGADLRRDLRHAGRNRRRAVNGFLDRVLGQLEQANAKLVARIYIKGPGAPFDGRAVYTSSVQSLCSSFHHFLGGLVGKGHGQNAAGRGIAVLQQPGDTRGEHARLARAGASQDERVARRQGDGGQLLVVQIGQEGRCCRGSTGVWGHQGFWCARKRVLWKHAAIVESARRWARPQGRQAPLPMAWAQHRPPNGVWCYALKRSNDFGHLAVRILVLIPD